MIKYKGYLIKEEHWRTERKEWDGHRNDGTGIYDNHSGWEITNLSTMKKVGYGHHDTLAQAKAVVDKLTARGSKTRDLTVKQKIALAKKQIEAIEKQEQAAHERFYDRKRKIETSIDKLKEKLLPEEW